MIRFYHITFAVLLILGAVACSKKEAQEQLVPPVGDSSAHISLGFGADTRAVHEATAEEKQLRSVALFVETAAGEFFSYFSDQPLGSAYGFHTATTTNGNYSHVEVKPDALYDINGTGKLIIVGNYANTDIEPVLKSATSIADLRMIRHTLAEGSALAAPFITLYESGVGGAPEFVISNSTYEFTGIRLPRLAARIDMPVTVNATTTDGDQVDPADISKFFQLVDAKVVGAKAASWLFEPAADASILAIAQTAEYTTGTPAGLCITFYAYEMRTGDTPLEVYVIYKTNQSGDNPTWTQHIQKITIPIGASGKIARNSYNTVSVIDSGLTFVISGITGWDDAGNPWGR